MAGRAEMQAPDKDNGAATSSADLTSAEDAVRPPGNPALQLVAAEAMYAEHLRADGPRGCVLPAATLAGGGK